MKISKGVFLLTAVTLIPACNIKSIEDKIVKEVIDDVVDYADALDETTSSASEPVRVLPPNPAGCPDWKKNVITEISESITLPQGCRYDRVSLRIFNQSDITLDCNGAELSGLDKEFRQDIGVPYSAARAPIDVGIMVQSTESFQSNNITIKNCKLRNYVRGIRASFSMSAASSYDLKNNINVTELEDYLRSVSAKNIRVENSSIEYSHKDGVFVGRFITDFVLNNSSIKYTGAVGLYLDSGSQRNTIQNSTISLNGHSDYDSNRRVRKRKLANDSREGIAIDSSAKNIIQNNVFSGNSRGSILIYKNCNEHHTDPKRIPRYQSADENMIRNNQFNNEDIGVWIASRQSKDLAALDCGSPLVATGTVRYGPIKETTKYYEDFAKYNQVYQNTFNNVDEGVIVEDDYASIVDNIFKGSADIDITVGTKYRTSELSHPVTGTTITGNQFDSSASTHIKLVYSPVETSIKDNTPEEVNN